MGNNNKPFWQKVQKSLEKHSKRVFFGTDYCLEWTGSRGHHGYGVKRVTWPSGESSREGSHIIAWMLAHRVLKWDVPRLSADGEVLEVSHLCHNKSCIRDSHLVLESHSFNMARIHCASSGSCREEHIPAGLFLDRLRVRA